MQIHQLLKSLYDNRTNLLSKDLLVWEQTTLKEQFQWNFSIQQKDN